MPKVFFLLSAVVIGITIFFFAIPNQREFTRVRTTVIGINNEAGKLLTDVNKVATEVAAVSAEVAKIQGDLDVESEKTKSQKLKLAQVDNDLKRDTSLYEEYNAKVVDLRKRLGRLPKGMKPETVAEEINAMKKSKAETESQIELKRKELAAEKEKILPAQREHADIVRKIEDRKKSFERNGLEGRVVAVNRDWGFVILDVGGESGVTEATKFLVTRGSRTIGKLSISQVLPKKTIANVLSEGVAQRAAVAPGDRVILESLVR
jgi:hypothetical protein